MMYKVAILVSSKGWGTNPRTIIKAAKSGKIKAEIAVVVSISENAPAYIFAKANKIPTYIADHQENIVKLLTQKFKVDYIALAGWPRIIPDELINEFQSRILNVHPGLIPDREDEIVKNPDGTAGLWNRGMLTNQAIGNFLNQKSTYAGSTVHYLSHEFDFGYVLGRCFEKIKTEDTVESLYKRLKVKENKLYVEVLAKLCSLATVMIIDGGGRGAALVDKYAQSKDVGRILVVPGNDLMQINTDKSVITYQHLKTTSVKEILEICQKEKVDLVDVAQDNAVAAGLVNELQNLKIQVFGPTKEAGQIEWDKAWARSFMQKYQIHHPKFYIFNSQKEGIEFVKKRPNSKWFVKASGLAEGKGAIPGSNVRQVTDAIKEMQKFGKAGETYLLEEWLQGEEFSAFAICDGKDFKIVGYAQDHKRVNDGDKGPNTGGMGCVSNPLVISNLKPQILNIFKKTTSGLIKEKRPYKGVLYLGGIVVEGKVWVIEFNARWGDPEAEAIIPGVKNDFWDLTNAIVSGQLKKLKLSVDKKVRVVVTATAKGYPEDYKSVKGKKVLGIDEVLKIGAKIYGAGIKKVDEDFVVNGGRVLFIVGEGNDVIEARDKAYKAMELINIEGNNLHYRKDIGWRDLQRLKK